MLKLIKEAILKSNLKSLYRKAMETKSGCGMKVSKNFKSVYQCTYLNDQHYYFQDEEGNELEKVVPYVVNVEPNGQVRLEEIHLNDYEVTMVDSRPFKRYRVSIYAVDMNL